MAANRLRLLNFLVISESCVGNLWKQIAFLLDEKRSASIFPDFYFYSLRYFCPFYCFCFLMRFHLFIASVIFLSLGMSGCGPKPPADFPKVYPATVTVLKDGTPLADVMVNFENKTIHISSGVTDAGGKAVIATKTPHYSAMGAPVGTYKVYLSKEPDLKSKLPDEEVNKMEPAQVQTYLAKLRAEKANTPRPLPAVLENANKTPLTIEVTESGGELKVEVSEHK